MGGDDAPGAVVAGAVAAARDGGIGVVLAGPREALQSALLDCRPPSDLPLRIVDADDVVGMHEAPLAALRRKPSASVRVAAEVVSRGEADALFSAGHTGATFLAAHAAFGRIANVERPALAVVVPTRAGATVLLDVGATLECRPAHLVQFGLMGAAYARVDLGRDQPTVGLLSISEESGIGTDLLREAHAGLAAAPLTFVGNIGAQDLFTGRADVVVCDGYTGNIALKVGEGLVEALEALLREELSSHIVERLGAALSRPAFDRFRRRVDYAESGGAPLLGVAKVTVVAHGRSSARAVRNGLLMAARLVGERVIERLADAMVARPRGVC
jgi:glycerol-3-phosphate acyltransferase PlsX